MEDLLLRIGGASRSFSGVEVLSNVDFELKKGEDTAIRFGYRGLYTDWEKMVNDPDIQIFDNCTPDNLHCEPSIAAAEKGKHIICEKPLSMTVEEAQRMVETMRKAGVKNMCCYNYRFIPAVRLAHNFIKNGLLGRIYHFRARYLLQIPHTPFRPLYFLPGTTQDGSMVTSTPWHTLLIVLLTTIRLNPMELLLRMA